MPPTTPFEGLRQWTIYHTISAAGGPPAQPRPLLHEGQVYDEFHPLPGVWKGRNSVMLGDHASAPLQLKDGVLLLPVETPPRPRRQTPQPWRRLHLG